jgi:hypothetical protein
VIPVDAALKTAAADHSVRQQRAHTDARLDAWSAHIWFFSGLALRSSHQPDRVKPAEEKAHHRHNAAVIDCSRARNALATVGSYGCRLAAI